MTTESTPDRRRLAAPAPAGGRVLQPVGAPSGLFTGLARRCRVCGCDDCHACYDLLLSGACGWSEEDLCTVCARAEAL